MATFGYRELYTNGLNSNTQIRRSVDGIYQRGANYQVVLTGDTYYSTMELDVDLYSDDVKVGRMAVTPFSITESGSTYTYFFNIRPYSYFENYIKSEHYNTYELNDWYTTNLNININNTYPNSIKGNIKYGYRYSINDVTTLEYSGSPENNLTHYTMIPFTATATGFTASDFTSTGYYFDYIGGTFQMNEHLILPNYDQELGSVMGTGVTLNSVDYYRRYSPMSQFLMDYPNLPEQSETGRFLTDAPRIQRIQSDEGYVLHYLAGQSGDRQVIEADYAVFEFYDSTNTRTAYFEQALNFSGTTYASPTGYTDNLRIFKLPCGPEDITNIFSSIAWSGVSYYRVQLFYGLPTEDTNRGTYGAIGPVSESFYFYLYENCYPEDTRLVFLNDRGGYDYYTFRSYREDKKKIERQTFNNRTYSTTITSPDRDVGRVVKTFDTQVDEEVILESEYLTVPIGNWLEQLFTSPQVYEMKEDYVSSIDRQDKVYKDLRPVQIISTEVETITKNHRKLNKYRISLKYADSYFVSKGF